MGGSATQKTSVFPELVFMKENAPLFQVIPFYCSCCCSVLKLCPTYCDPLDCSSPGFPVLHHLLELAQTHMHWFGYAIQSSCPLLPPSPPAFNLSQHQGVFQWVSNCPVWPSFLWVLRCHVNWMGVVHGDGFCSASQTQDRSSVCLSGIFRLDGERRRFWNCASLIISFQGAKFI